MMPERWNQIEEIFHTPAEAEQGQRAALLDAACGDDELRKQVETLVIFDEQKDGFLDKPAFAEGIGLLMDNPTMPLQRLRNHYIIVSLLGKGGMAEVYEANDTTLFRKVAIKFPSAETVRDAQTRKLLISEARAAARLDHPNICEIIEAVDEGDHCYIVMEYVDGVTLRGSRGYYGSGAMGPRHFWKWLLEVAIQVAGALEEAHKKGIIHRDIKPTNIMITSEGTVKVIDFGVAKVYELGKATGDERESQTPLPEDGKIPGTRAYMSPEQARGEELDSRSDIFSFGIVLFEMISGKNPFDKGTEAPAETMAAILGDDPPRLPRSQDVPIELQSDLERIVRKALYKTKEQRYQSIGDMQSELKALGRALESEEAQDDIKEQRQELDAQQKREFDAAKKRRSLRVEIVSAVLIALFLVLVVWFILH